MNILRSYRVWFAFLFAVISAFYFRLPISAQERSCWKTGEDSCRPNCQRQVNFACSDGSTYSNIENCCTVPPTATPTQPPAPTPTSQYTMKTYTPIADADIRSGRPDESFGTDRALRTGYREDNSDKVMRTLLKFDLSDIPQGSTIHSTRLFMNLGAHSTTQSIIDISATRISGPWDETITWNTYRTLSTSVGGITSSSVGQTLNEYVTWDLTAMLNDWLNTQNRGTSFSVVLQGLEDQGYALRAFYSKDCSESLCNTSYPKLEIQYTQPVPPTDPTIPQSTPIVSTTVTSTITPATSPCPKKRFGDANCDDKINTTDYDIWKAEFTRARNTKDADVNNDQKVTLHDFEVWRTNQDPRQRDE